MMRTEDATVLFGARPRTMDWVDNSMPQTICRPGRMGNFLNLLEAAIRVTLSLAVIVVGLVACQIEWPLAEPVPESTPQPVAAAPAATSVPLPIVTPVALPPPPTSIPTYTPVPTPTPPAPPTATPAPSPTTGPTTQPTSTPSVTATPTLEQLLEFLPTATPAPQPTTQLTFVATPVPVPISTATPIPTPDLPPPTRDLEAALVWLDHLVPWFLDPPAAEYEEGAGYLLDMWFLDPYLAIEMAHMYWLPTGLEEEEVEALSLVAHIGSIDIEEARKLSGYPWITNGILGNDIRLIQKLQGSILLRDLLWAHDGMAILEPRAWTLLLLLAEADPHLVEELKTAPWIVDGIDQRDIQSLEKLLASVSVDVNVINLLFTYPWAADGVNEAAERDLLSALAKVSKRDPQLAHFVASLPALAKANNLYWERNWITAFAEIAIRDLDLAWQLAKTFNDFNRGRDRYLVTGLRFLAWNEPALFRQLAEQDWVRDGINDSEAAFLAATEDIARNSPGDFEQMLKVRYTQQNTVLLPVSGPVTIWVTQRTPFPEGDDLVEKIAGKLLEVERTTDDVPWEQDFLVHVVVVEPGSESDALVRGSIDWPNPARAGGHIRIPRIGRDSSAWPAMWDYLNRFLPVDG